jgi:hypothetical protein
MALFPMLLAFGGVRLTRYLTPTIIVNSLTKSRPILTFYDYHGYGNNIRRLDTIALRTWHGGTSDKYKKTETKKRP